MEELKKFPEDARNTLKVLFIAFDETSHRYAFENLIRVRQAGINAEIYPDPVKIQKQMKYANDRQVPFVVLVGESERNNKQLTLKNMASGEQQTLVLEDLLKALK